VRALLPTCVAVLVLAAAASAAEWHPATAWLAQARCVHLKEGVWHANTGNGYFGGMQFAAKTWKRMRGAPDDSFAHPGDAAYPFSVSVQEQLYRAWLVWKRDGGSWRAWGAVGAACSS
jgi:resuscitation-promoting factor RpfA